MQISLKAARVNANISQEDAARLLKISKGTLASYEKYKTAPSMERAQQVAALYGVDVNDIKWCN